MLRAAPPSPLKGPATWMEEEEMAEDIISHGGLYQSCEEHSVAFEDPHFFIGP